jgi:hypothetical protein
VVAIEFVVPLASAVRALEALAYLLGDQFRFRVGEPLVAGRHGRTDAVEQPAEVGSHLVGQVPSALRMAEQIRDQGLKALQGVGGGITVLESNFDFRHGLGGNRDRRPHFL